MKRLSSRLLVLAFAVLGASAGCRDDEDAGSTSGDERASNEPRFPRGASRPELCTETGDQYLQMPYDTNGDGAPDVFRIYLLTEGGASRRLVCREADLNSDGVRDTVRVYDQRGRVAREQQDRDFDGRADYWEYFQDGRLIRRDEDANRDGRVDTRVYVDVQERPVRIERDVAGRSVSGIWRADHFEFFDEGRLIRAGEDVDFDGRVDRWDRDLVYEAEREARERAAARAARAERGEPEPEEDAGVGDAGVPLAATPDSGMR